MSITKKNFEVQVTSFGYKYYQMPTANLLLDVRFLMNPFYDPKMRLMSGLDQQVADYIWSLDGADQSYQDFKKLVDQTLPLYIKKADSSDNFAPRIEVAFACTGGQHRSVAFAQRLAEDLIAEDYQVTINHRDLAESLKREQERDI